MFNFERLYLYLKEINIENKSDITIYNEQVTDLLLKTITITLEHRCGRVNAPSYINMQSLPSPLETSDKEIKKYNSLDEWEQATIQRALDSGTIIQIGAAYFTLLQKKYLSINWQNLAMDYSLLGLFIEKGILPKKALLIDSFKQDYQLRKPHQDGEDISNLWIRLFRWQFKNPTELQENLSSLMEALKNNKFLKMGDILQVISRIQSLIAYDYNPLPNHQNTEGYFTEYLQRLNELKIPGDFSDLEGIGTNTYKGREYTVREDSDLFKKIQNNIMERAIKSLKVKKDLIDFISRDDFTILTEKLYLSFPLMNYIAVNDYIKLIDITSEIKTLPIRPLEALKERYHFAAHLKAEEQDWLSKLKRAVYLQIDELPVPYKSQRRELFDREFKDLEPS